MQSKMIPFLGAVALWMGMLLLAWVFSLPGRSAHSSAVRYPGYTSEKDFQYGKDTAEAVYLLAWGYLSPRELEAFAQRLALVNGEGDDAQCQFIEIASDITMAALYGIAPDESVENVKTLNDRFDWRQATIIELQHLAQMALSARQRATKIGVPSEELEKAQKDFERAKQLLLVRMRRYKAMYDRESTQ